MRRLILNLLTIFLFSGSAWGVDYYLAADDQGYSKSKSSPYSSWATAADNVNEITSLIETESDSTDRVFMAPGTYTIGGNILHVDHANYVNTSFIGTNFGDAASDTGDPTVWEDVIWEGSNVHGVYATHLDADNLTFRNMTFISNGEFRTCVWLDAEGIDGWEFYWVRFIASENANTTLVSLDGCENLIMDHVVLRQDESDKGPFRFAGDTSGTISHFIIEAGPTEDGMYSYITCSQSGTLTFNNGWVSGAYTEAFKQTNGGTLILNNVGLTGVIHGSGETLEASGGTITANNCFVAGTILGGATSSGTVTFNNCIYVTEGHPKLTALQRKGYVTFMVDDGGGYAYIQAEGGIEEQLAAHGYTGTWFIHQRDIDNVDKELKEGYIKSIFARGTMEIAAHSYGHTDMTLTDAYNFTCSGCSDPKFKYDLTNSLLSLDNDGDGSAEGTASLDLSPGSPYYRDGDNDSVISVAFDAANTAAGGGWTLNYETNASPYCHSSTIASVEAWTAAGTSLAYDKTDCDCSDGCSGFYNDEIVEVKSWLETLMDSAVDPQTGEAYVCNTFAPPFNQSDDDLKTSVRTAGYIGARGEPISILTNMNLYNTSVISSAHWTVNDDEAATKAKVRNLLFNAAMHGVHLGCLTHSASEASYEEFGWVLEVVDEFVAAGLIECKSFQLCLKDFKASPWTYNASTGYTTRVYTGLANDYVLQPTSPCINAGIDPFSDGDGDQTDMAGYTIWSDTTDGPVGRWADGIEIGAYALSSCAKQVILFLEDE